MRHGLRLWITVFAVGLPGVGCARVSYVPTGAARPALDEDAPVAVHLTRWPAPPYQEIGVVEVNASPLARRVEAAQREARRRGGNAIVLIGSATHVDTSTSSRTVEAKDPNGNVTSRQEVPVTSTSTSQIQTFAILSLPR